jgi:CheY-like chemotaxis protein
MPEPLSPDRPAVLVVDADPGVRRMLAAAFRQWGVTARFAEDGIEAVEACRQHGPAFGLALVEVHLPRMDGPSAIAAMRAFCPKLSCWFIGGIGGGYSQSDLRDCGAEGLLPKPFDLQALRTLLGPLAGPVPRPMPGAEVHAGANPRGWGAGGLPRASAT